jgi:predicted nucleotidyltransferase
MMTPELLTSILGRYPEIGLAFLFGSAASGRMTAESDIDVAVFFQPGPDIDRCEDIREALTKATHREVDLVILNQASPILRMQVLKKGIPLIKNEKMYGEFFVRTLCEYDDLKRTRKVIEDRILSETTHAA